MSGYLVPFEAAESEFTEKRSRFIGRICRVETEEEARSCVEKAKKDYHDARHHCWSYILKSGAIRYSDDGEPQGTAGQPILNVLQRQAVVNVCCVVTRYFGGILLGAGGLTRAYGHGAEIALQAAGICRMSPWTRWKIPCSYPLFERTKTEIASCGGTVRNVEYGENVTIDAAFPDNGAEHFALRFTEISAGRGVMMPDGGEDLPGPRENSK